MSLKFVALQPPQLLMSDTIRATVYLDSQLHKALRLKAASTRRSVSELVAEAVRESLREDQEDLAAVRNRAAEPSVSYEVFLKKLKTDGTL